MKILNLCAGATRPQDEAWWNLDNLHEVLLPGTPERDNLDSEPRYINVDVLKDRLPFNDDDFDGIIASHCIEHWTCQEAIAVMRECLRILKPNGVLLASVPDASYHRQVYHRDTVENAQELFGEPIHLPDGETNFLGYGLFNRWHKTVMTEDVLWSYFVRTGFPPGSISRETDWPYADSLGTMIPKLNRRKFSLEMWAQKPL